MEWNYILFSVDEFERGVSIWLFISNVVCLHDNWYFVNPIISINTTDFCQPNHLYSTALFAWGWYGDVFLWLIKNSCINIFIAQLTKCTPWSLISVKGHPNLMMLLLDMNFDATPLCMFRLDVLSPILWGIQLQWLCIWLQCVFITLKKVQKI